MKKKLITLTVLICSSLVFGEITETGNYDTNGSSFDVSIMGIYAYIADGTNGIVTCPLILVHLLC